MNGKTLVASLILAAGTVSGAVGQAPAVPVAAPAPPHTLWSFLGIPQGCQKINGALFNRKGKHPGLEKKPPLKALADPANLASDVPVIRKAAQVKVAEDLKGQKIKAIRYLAKIGCGCYDTDGGITAAMVAATDDCTEDVRLAAVEAISDAASGGCCSQCGKTCCCSEPVLKRLAKMAYERDEHGCYVEPSERVRQAAIRALNICCPNTAPVEVEEEETPTPVPPREEAPTPGTPPREEAPTIPQPETPLPPVVDGQANYRPAAGMARSLASAGAEPFGILIFANAQRNIAHVHFQQEDMTVPVGTRLLLECEDQRPAQQLEVVQSFAGSANVRCIDAQAAGLLHVGAPIAMHAAPIVTASPTPLVEHRAAPIATTPSAALHAEQTAAPIATRGAARSAIPAPLVNASHAAAPSPAPVINLPHSIRPSHGTSSPAGRHVGQMPPLPNPSVSAATSSRRVQPPLPPTQLGHKVSYQQSR